MRPELIANTADLTIQLGLGKTPCAAGKQFGSQFPVNPARTAVHDFLPDEQLAAVRNLSDFLGVLVLDKWTCNTNGRQAIFFREADGPPASPGAAAPYLGVMIDFGFCFNAGEWNFPDAPLRGLYTRQLVYKGVAGMESFEPWLSRLREQISERTLGEEAARIPPEWYAGDWSALEQLLERLYRRRERVPELLLSARNSGREPFPNWKVKYA